MNKVCHKPYYKIKLKKKKYKKRPCRLTVRTSPSQGENMGSIPVRVTIWEIEFEFSRALAESFFEDKILKGKSRIAES
jgi:hypothetical protein